MKSCVLGWDELMASAVCCKEASLRSVMAIFSHPAAAKAFAVAAPIPWR
jgi:hypothetical protein